MKNLLMKIIRYNFSLEDLLLIQFSALVVNFFCFMFHSCCLPKDPSEPHGIIFRCRNLFSSCNWNLDSHFREILIQRWPSIVTRRLILVNDWSKKLSQKWQPSKGPYAITSQFYNLICDVTWSFWGKYDVVWTSKRPRRSLELPADSRMFGFNSLIGRQHFSCYGVKCKTIAWHELFTVFHHGHHTFVFKLSKDLLQTVKRLELIPKISCNSSTKRQNKIPLIVFRVQSSAF